MTTTEIPVFPPNPAETIAPTDAIDAFSTALVALTADMPREVVQGHLAETDINAVVLAAQGLPIHDTAGGSLDRELNPVERQLSDTVQWCSVNGLVRAPHEAVNGLEIVRDMVEDGGVFVGRERPYSDYDRPQ